MNKRLIHSTIAILCGALLLGYACKPKKPKWEAGYLVPLLSTSLNIDKLVSDSILREEDDQSLTLVYEQSINTVDLSDLVDIPTTSFSRNYKLSNLNLNDQHFVQNITLGTLAQSWPGWGPLILASNGGSLALPDITGVSGGPYPVSIQNVFQSATLNGGLLDITITNGYPVDLDNVQFEISNVSSGTVIINHTFPSIPTGTSQTATFNMAGKTIEGNLNVRLVNMDVMGGGQTYPINVNDALRVDMTLRNLQIQTATAVFPAQEIINEEVNARLQVGDPKLKHARLRKGKVELQVVSTAQDSIYFKYKFPTATKNGVEFEINEVIPPATSTTPSNNLFTYDFSNYDLDLTGDFGVYANVLKGVLIGRIDSTGFMATLDLNDSIYINLKVKNLEPTYVDGYLGNYSNSAGPVTENFSLFQNFLGGTIDLEEVQTIFSIENSVGISGVLNVNELKGMNTRTNNEVALQSTLIGSDIVIDRATDNPLTSTHKEIILDPTNSNVTDLISNMPDALTYGFQLDLNKGLDSTTTSFNDFAYEDGYVNSKLGLQMPLSMIANDLLLGDTILLDDNTLTEIEGARGGTLNLIADNGFPISADMEILFLDADYQQTKTLASDQIIEAATLVNGRSTELNRSVISYTLTQDDVNSIVQSKGIYIKVKFNSGDLSNYQKIYSDYEIRVKLTGEFVYQN